MRALARPARCPGNLRPKAKRGGLSGMGMARPRWSAESDQHRPHTSSPQRVSAGRERVKQRQTPCPHWTRGQRPPAAAHAWPSKSMTRCRQVAIASEATVKGDRLTPPAPHSAAASMVCECPRSGDGRQDNTLRPGDGRSVPPNPIHNNRQNITRRDEVRKGIERRLNRAARDTSEKWQDAAFTKYSARKDRGRKANGTYGPASNCRRIDPKTGKVIEIMEPRK